MKSILNPIYNNIKDKISVQDFKIVEDAFSFAEERHKGQKLQKGMVFCIEPMLTMGTWKIKLAKDGFTFKTEDNSLVAHFEDMVAVTDDGCIILTK